MTTRLLIILFWCIIIASIEKDRRSTEISHDSAVFLAAIWSMFLGYSLCKEDDP